MGSNADFFPDWDGEFAVKVKPRRCCEGELLLWGYTVLRSV